MPGELPVAVAEVRGEISERSADSWTPASYSEWESQQRTRTFLAAWNEQMTDERKLRSFSAKAIFGLVSAQVLASFAIVVAQGLGYLQLDKTIIEIMIPSVLTEVFGLGYLVTKYLFNQPLRHGLNALAQGTLNANGSSPSD